MAGIASIRVNVMVNRPTIITGCQRSGTTLLSLILDSHPQIKSVDETEFDNDKLQEYLGHPAYHPCVAFKLPGDAASFQSFKTLPGIKTLWCMRDPRDVVLSMVSLTMEIVAGHGVVWANHELGAMREIESCLRFHDYLRSPVDIREYLRVRQIPYFLRDRKDAVLMGALCWELKNALLDLYAGENIPYMPVIYEDLIRAPRATLEEILSFLDLPWHDDVLHHHEMHNGTYAGNTLGNKPIDPSNTGKWQQGLSNEELAIVASCCAERAKKFGYHLPAATRSISANSPGRVGVI